MPETQQRDPETQWDIVSSVGLTALAVAGGRATESQRPDRLIDDPFADPMVQATGPETNLPGYGPDDPNRHLMADMANYIGVRSRFFDDFFDGAAATGVRQAVILASGLDTRGYRLGWPEGTRVFEIDQPLVLEFKDTILGGLGAEASSELHNVAVDLRDDWTTALRASGFDPALPTAWLAEGLLPYLPAAAEAQLLAKIHELSAPGSRVSIESVPGDRSRLLEDQSQHLPQDSGMNMEELFNTESRAEPSERLSEFGWQVRKQSAPEVAAGYGRELTGFATVISGHQSFLTAELP